MITQKLKVSGQNIVKADGSQFAAFGHNYQGGAMTDIIETVWATQMYGAAPSIENDLSVLNANGSKIIRTCFQLDQFMTDVNNVSSVQLDRLYQYCDLCAKYDIYLIINGCNTWVSANQPDWLTWASEAERWTAMQNFWAAVARKVGSHPAVAWYSLINEPVSNNYPEFTATYNSGPNTLTFNYSTTDPPEFAQSPTLTSGIDASATTIPVTSTTGFPTASAFNPQTIKIGSEYILYSGMTSNSFISCVRGQNLSTAASHSSGSPVTTNYGWVVITKLNGSVWENEFVSYTSTTVNTSTKLVTLNGISRGSSNGKGNRTNDITNFTTSLSLYELRTNFKNWLSGDFGNLDRHYQPIITLTPLRGGRTINSVAQSWVDAMITSIRGYDLYTPITLGAVMWNIGGTGTAATWPTQTSWGTTNLLSKLDLWSTHQYLSNGANADLITALSNVSNTKPVFLEEGAIPFGAQLRPTINYLLRAKRYLAGALNNYNQANWATDPNLWQLTFDTLKPFMGDAPSSDSSATRVDYSNSTSAFLALGDNRPTVKGRRYLSPIGDVGAGTGNIYITPLDNPVYTPSDYRGVTVDASYVSQIQLKQNPSLLPQYASVWTNGIVGPSWKASLNSVYIDPSRQTIKSFKAQASIQYSVQIMDQAKPSSVSNVIWGTYKPTADGATYDVTTVMNSTPSLGDNTLARDTDSDGAISDTTVDRGVIGTTNKTIALSSGFSTLPSSGTVLVDQEYISYGSKTTATAFTATANYGAGGYNLALISPTGTPVSGQSITGADISSGTWVTKALNVSGTWWVTLSKPTTNGSFVLGGSLSFAAGNILNIATGGRGALNTRPANHSSGATVQSGLPDTTSSPNGYGVTTNYCGPSSWPIAWNFTVPSLGASRKFTQVDAYAYVSVGGPLFSDTAESSASANAASSGQKDITFPSSVLAKTGFRVGALVRGTNIPNGARIHSISAGGTTITLDQNLTSNVAFATTVYAKMVFPQQQVKVKVTDNVSAPFTTVYGTISQYKGVWASGTTYVSGDIVWYTDRLYQCFPANGTYTNYSVNGNPAALTEWSVFNDSPGVSAPSGYGIVKFSFLRDVTLDGYNSPSNNWINVLISGSSFTSLGASGPTTSVDGFGATRPLQISVEPNMYNQYTVAGSPTRTVAYSGTSTGSTSTTLTDSAASWGAVNWSGSTINVFASGTTVTSATIGGTPANTATQLNLSSAWSNGTPASGRPYWISSPANLSSTIRVPRALINFYQGGSIEPNDSTGATLAVNNASTAISSDVIGSSVTGWQSSPDTAYSISQSDLDNNLSISLTTSASTTGTGHSSKFLAKDFQNLNFNTAYVEVSVEEKLEIVGTPVISM